MMNNNCAYCQNGIGNLPLVSIDIDAGVLGKVAETAYLQFYDDSAFINFELNSYGIGGKRICKSSEKIHYCPICSRKLTNN